MKVLVTGGAGMVGRNFLANPRARDFEISAPSRTDLNLLDGSAVSNFVGRVHPDVIVHCAGRVGGIAANVRNPAGFYYENILIGMNLFNAAVESKVPKVLNLGSSCIYPKLAESPIQEESLLTGEMEKTNEGYALAKASVIRYAEYLEASNRKTKFRTLIPCNLYGKYDKFDSEAAHMIPAAIAKTLAAKESKGSIVIWGDGSARREFMYAGEFVKCLWRAVEQFDSLPKVMNVGLGCDYSILEYYKLIAEVVGYEQEFEFDLDKPSGVYRKLVSTEKMAEWGWSPSLSLRDGIAQTVDYYRSIVR